MNKPVAAKGSFSGCRHPAEAPCFPLSLFRTLAFMYCLCAFALSAYAQTKPTPQQIQNICPATGSDVCVMVSVGGKLFAGILPAGSSFLPTGPSSGTISVPYGAAPSDVYSEEPAAVCVSGACTYPLAHVPLAGTVRMYVNGVRQIPKTGPFAVGNGNIVNPTGWSPQNTDDVSFDYKFQP